MRAGDRAGLGLVELLVAASILAVALVGLFQVLGLSLRGVETVEEEVVATTLAADLIDFLATIPHRRLPGAGGCVTHDDTTLPQALESADPQLAERVRRKFKGLGLPPGYRVNMSFDALCSVGPAVSACPAGLKRIVVTVEAQAGPGRNGVARRVTLSRLLVDDAEVEP